MKQNVFKCFTCEQIFNNKSKLDRHFYQKKECMKGNVDMFAIEFGNFEKNIKCEYCGNGYSTEDHLRRHISSEKSKCYKKRNSAQINNVSVLNMPVNNIAVQPVVNNLHKHYTIAKHGEETTSHFTEEVLLRILNIENFTDCCAEFMRVLYFNKEVPENQNWSIVYPRNKKAGVHLNYDTNKFERVENSDIIDSKFSNMAFLLFPKALKLLERHFIKPFLTKTQVYNINKLGMHFGMMNISKTSKDVYKAVHKMAYEERQKQMDTWRESGHKGNHLSLKF